MQQAQGILSHLQVTYTAKNLPNRPKRGGLFFFHMCAESAGLIKKPSQETQQPARQKYLVGSNRNIASLYFSHQSRTAGHDVVQEEHTASATRPRKKTLQCQHSHSHSSTEASQNIVNTQTVSGEACMYPVCQMGKSTKCTQDANSEAQGNSRKWQS